MAETQNQPIPPTQPPSTNPPPATGGSDKDARLWCMLCHLAIIVPCCPCLITLILWLMKKNEFPSVDTHGKRALNFQISLFIVMFAIGLICFMLIMVHLGILVLLIRVVSFLIWICAVVLGIIAGIKANNGEDYEYPWSLKLIK